MSHKDEEHRCTGCDCEHEGHEGEEEEVYVFTDEDGQEREFFLAEVLPLDDKEYAIFLPLDEEESEEEDVEEETTVVILRVEEDEQGEASVVDLEDESEANRVLKAWEAMLEEEEEEEEGPKA